MGIHGWHDAARKSAPIIKSTSITIIIDQLAIATLLGLVSGISSNWVSPGPLRLYDYIHRWYLNLSRFSSPLSPTHQTESLPVSISGQDHRKSLNLIDTRMANRKWCYRSLQSPLDLPTSLTSSYIGFTWHPTMAASKAFQKDLELEWRTLRHMKPGLASDNGPQLGAANWSMTPGWDGLGFSEQIEQRRKR